MRRRYAIEKAVRTKIVEKSPVYVIIAVIECALPSGLTLYVYN